MKDYMRDCTNPKEVVSAENDRTGKTGIQTEPVTGRVTGSYVPCQGYTKLRGRMKTGYGKEDNPVNDPILNVSKISLLTTTASIME